MTINFKNILQIIALSLLTNVALGQQEALTLTGNITGCKKDLVLSKFDGAKFYPVQKAKKDGDTYTLQIDKTKEPDFYFIGEEGGAFAPILLGTEPDVKVQGHCANLRAASYVNSEVNVDYNRLKQDINKAKNERDRLTKMYVRAKKEEERKLFQGELKKLDDRQMATFDSLNKAFPLFGKIYGLNIYPSFANNNKGYKNELDYFVDKYFQFADFSQASFSNLPWVYEGFKAFASTLSRSRVPADQLKQAIESNLKKVPAKTRTYKLALGGVMAGLKQASNENYSYFAKMFIEEFKDVDPDAVKSLQKEIENVGKYQVGGTPPDFSQPTPSGEEFALSQLKGNVVLIDFWASWCGPCRRENPNVLKVYNKYHDKGFEILGVSLDKKKDRWLAAIKKDGLPWHQISDLKGWQNKVANDFGVRSIPHTILIGKDGKIIARGLRGRALEAKLAELLGGE